MRGEVYLYFPDTMDQDVQTYCEKKAEYVYKRCLIDIYLNPYRFIPIPRDPIMMPIVPELHCLQDLHDTYGMCIKDDKGSD